MLVDLKIKVSSEAESKEAQDLFFELGYVWHDTKCKTQMRYVEPVYYSSFDDMELACDVSDVNYKHKEITLPELRDMVVLKRNDVGGATHENNHGQKLYKAQKGWYIYALGSWLWNEESLGYLPIELKPIKKKEMKEYLVKSQDGKWRLEADLVGDPADTVIEVPYGADTLAGDHNYCYFWQHGADKKHLLIGCGSSLERYPNWTDCKDSADEWLSNFDGDNSLRILWQRETLNDQVASASSQGQSEFPLNNYELNHRVAKAFNAVRGTDLNEDDVNYLRELINLTVSHYGERK